MKKQFKVLGGLVLSLGIVACGGGGEGPEATPPPSTGSTPLPTPQQGGDVDLTAMFTNIADNVIIPNYAAFKASAETFAAPEGVLQTYCSALGTEDEAARLVDAQSAWKGLMLQWQQAEMHNLGPAAENSNALRNRIYSFGDSPIDNCRIDRGIVVAEGDDNFDISTRQFSALGLVALDYLLFETDLNHSCVVENDNVEGWNERPEQERKELRCDYAMLAAADVSAIATEIHNEWLSDGGNYRQTFIGDEDSQELALTLLSDALFYVETGVKDLKLGVPLGLHSDCNAEACPDEVESGISQHAVQNIGANIEGFMALYNGGENGLGFDDIIRAADMDEINTAFTNNANSILEVVRQMTESNDTITAQAQSILDAGSNDECVNNSANASGATVANACALHGLLKQMTDRMRVEFVTVVGVDLPDRVRGDTD